MSLTSRFPRIECAVFTRLRHADPEVRERLAEWLAYHLSNFEYMWPWPKWGQVLTAPPHDPQRCAAIVDPALPL